MLIKRIDFFKDLYPAYEHQKDLFRAFFSGQYRYYCVNWHRRAGKDSCFFQLAWLVASLEKGTYLYTLPKIAQAKNIVLEGTDLKGNKWIDSIPKHLIKSINLSERKIHFANGSILAITGADSILDSQLGSNLRGIFMSEYQRSAAQSWDYLRPIVLRSGGFAAFNFTSFGKNHAYHLLKNNEENPDWYCQTLTVDDTKDHSGNPIFSPEQIQGERDSGMDEDLIQQEYYCDFNIQVKGTYFAEQMQLARSEGRIVKDLQIYPNLPVHTSWDLGSRDTNSVWFFQVIGTGQNQQFRYFYEHSSNYQDIDYFIKLMYSIREQFGFNGYGTNFMPHDVKQSEWSTGKSRRTALMQKGINVSVVPMMRVIERVQVARSMLGKCWFKEDTCKNGILALEASRCKYDDTLKAFSSDEVHDWASHASAAFQYGQVGWAESHNQAHLQKQREYAKYRP